MIGQQEGGFSPPRRICETGLLRYRARNSVCNRQKRQRQIHAAAGGWRHRFLVAILPGSALLHPPGLFGSACPVHCPASSVSTLNFQTPLLLCQGSLQRTPSGLDRRSGVSASLLSGHSRATHDRGCGPDERRRISCGSVILRQTSAALAVILWLRSQRCAQLVFAASYQQKTMNATAVVPSLLALFLANGTSVLDCLCSHINNSNDQGRRWRMRGSRGEYQLWWQHCQHTYDDTLSGTRGTLEPPSAAVPAVARLAASISSYGPPPPPAAEGEGEVCDGALAALRRLSWDEANQLGEGLSCRISADCIASCPVPRLNDVEWNVTALQADHLRHRVLSQSLHAVGRITRAILARGRCEIYNRLNFKLRYSNETGLQVQQTVYLEQLSSYWRDFEHLFSLAVTHASRLFIPLAFEYMGNNTTDQRLHGWIKNMERVQDMLHTKLSSWLNDVQSVRDQIAHYEVEDDKNRTGYFILRRPLWNDILLDHQPKFIFFREDFSAPCEERQPEASQMFGLADALYAFYYTEWFRTGWSFKQRFADDPKTVGLSKYSLSSVLSMRLSTVPSRVQTGDGVPHVPSEGSVGIPSLGES
ncbi:uncharacterized protein LOC126442761 [Schistocerca serialis cubense]|uniref:uncharacterized protein LOC126442761 n=1 Tax=Schistocerca serialis cubense TaxID=2023355 RepID=UPI00214EE04C|nr:uncharacterized protein LOC126442761 [Schistocerca serialis cubense]